MKKYWEQTKKGIVVMLLVSMLVPHGFVFAQESAVPDASGSVSASPEGGLTAPADSTAETAPQETAPAPEEGTPTPEFSSPEERFDLPGGEVVVPETSDANTPDATPLSDPATENNATPDTAEAPAAVEPETTPQEPANPEAENTVDEDPPAPTPITGLEQIKNSASETRAKVQGLSDLFSYDLFTGEAGFQFPVTLPQGRNSLTPSLALSYSSFSKNYASTAGFGFDLSQNSIYRSSRHGIDEMYERDEFVASFSKGYAELVLIDASKHLYQNKDEEGNFNTYFFENNTWRVVDAEGTTYFFGSDASARQSDSKNANLSSPEGFAEASKTFRWYLQKVQDIHGDTIEYGYETSGNQVYLKNIRWAFTDNKPLYEAQILYTAKSKAITSYQAGFKIDTDKLVSKITVTVNDTETPRVISEYTLSYEDAETATPKLTSITQQSGDVALPSVGFEYYQDTGSAHLLKTIKNGMGGEIRLSYASSVKYKDLQGVRQNMNLPFIIQTLKQIEYVDSVTGVSETKTFSYAGGHYYYSDQDVFGRRYAGFHQVSVTDSDGFVQKQFFHQSQMSRDESSVFGEYEDHISKKGKAFRSEVYDRDGNLVQLTLTKWERVRLPDADPEQERGFVFGSLQIKADYETSGSFRASSESFTYDDTTGNVLTETKHGEVTSSLLSWNFEDIADDTVITKYLYAKPVSENTNLTSFASQKTVYEDVADEAHKRAETKFSYDGLAFGSVSRGDVTREEAWLKNEKENRWVTVQNNTYFDNGLMKTSADAAGNTTAYTYDIFSLYPATITKPETKNAAGQTVPHVTLLTYEYATGQLTKMTDENGNAFERTYDGLGRVREVKVPASAELQRGEPDLMNNNSLTTLFLVTYDDVSKPAKKLIQKKDTSLDLVQESVEYTDGFGRVIEKKEEADPSSPEGFEGARSWNTVSIVYDERGKVKSETLAYETSSKEYIAEVPSTIPKASYAYDALGRSVSVTTQVGTSKTVYSGWEVTQTDPMAHKKEFAYDAFGNLIGVKEHAKNPDTNIEEIFTTSYVYDVFGNLQKITDAEGNIREFVYDTLSRRTALSDLYPPTPAGFGEASPTSAEGFGEASAEYYEYFDTGAVKKKTAMSGDVVSFTYDALNRVVSEDCGCTTGIDVRYAYDNTEAGKNGIGKLHTVSKGGVQTTYAYDALGNAITVTKNYTDTQKRAHVFTQSYLYDLAGRLISVTSPAGYTVRYEYNAGGRAEKVWKKFSGTLTELTLYGKNGALNESTFVPQVSADTAEVLVIKNIDYHPNGGISKVEYGNLDTEEYVYDANELYRLRTKMTKDGKGTVLQNLAYTYDALGNILTLTDSGTTNLAKKTSYVYDDLSRLLSVKIENATKGENAIKTYRYSPTGNILETSELGKYMYAKDAGVTKLNPQAVVKIVNDKNEAVREFVYDTAGRMISEKYLENGKSLSLSPSESPLSREANETQRGAGDSDATSSIEKKLTWNYRNELVKGEWYENNVLKSTIVFAYDADGARIGKENTDKTHANFYPFSNYEEEYEYAEGREVYRLRYATSLGASTPQKQVVSLLLSDTGTTEPTPEVKPASEIQILIDAAPAGSTVEVPAGTYAGNIVLKQGIKLHGAGPSKTILDGKLTGSVVTMASDTELAGFQIRNSGSKTLYVIENRKKVVSEINAGVFVPSHAKNVVVKDNYFDNNYEGLFVIKASNVSIENNLIVNQRYDGINISEGSDVKVLRNTIDKNKILRGIKVYKTALLQIKNNLVTNNNGGVYCSSVPTNAVISYNDVYSNRGSGRIASSEYSGCTAGAGSVSVDPKYVNIGANAMEKHELKPDSPVLKAGENSTKLGWTRPTENIPQPTQKGPKLINGVFYTHTDHLGSSSITISDTGIVKQLADYYAYGSTRIQEDSADYQDEHLYTGKEYDEELGLYYYVARYYNPAVGRFVSQDPLSKLNPEKLLNDPQSLNFYAYARNNPITFIDPNGENPVAILLGVLAGIFLTDITPAQAPAKFNNWCSVPEQSKTVGELYVPGYDELPGSVKFVAPIVVGGLSQGVKKGGLKIGKDAMEHIMYGNRGGGKHVLKNILQRGEKVFDIQDIGNGVRRGLIKNNKGKEISKAFYPDNWVEKDIQDALDFVSKNGQRIPGTNNTYPLEFNGIILEGRLDKNDTITSVFPSFSQQ